MASRTRITRRLKLLTYPMALAQPDATVPLVSTSRESGGHAGASSALTSRRWVRSAEELCVASVHRSSRLLTNYAITYKFNDPQWRPLLQLPCGNPIAAELRSRHANFALRHIVQKGHAMYLITHSQHSVLAPHGLIEQSMATCSYGIKGERLRTSIVHEGPLDAACPTGARGIVALSQVEGYGTWFQRKPMLWQRSRRIGALQASMGAFEWSLCSPEDVGRRSDCEVMLLQPHLRFMGAGVESVGIVASSQIAQHPYLYVGEFDAPAAAALDAVHQLAYVSARRNKLVTPPSTAAQPGGDQRPCEGIHAMAWVTRSPPPYVPLETDLPFKLQMSRPVVFGADDVTEEGTVGAPLVSGAPLFRLEYNIHQGMEHYVYDDAPSARPMKWWSQKNNLPYSGHMYFIRDGNVGKLRTTEKIRNPFARESRRKPLHHVVPPTALAKRRVDRYARAQARRKSTSAGGAASATQEGTTPIKEV